MESNFELDLILGNQPDCRGPMQLDDELPESPVTDFFEELQMEHLAKNAGTPSAATVVPTVDEILGFSPVMGESFEKHEAVDDPAKMTLVKSAMRASRHGQVRLEKTVIDGETWVCGYDHEGVEVFSKPFVQEVEA